MIYNIVAVIVTVSGGSDMSHRIYVNVPYCHVPLCMLKWQLMVVVVGTCRKAHLQQAFFASVPYCHVPRPSNVNVPLCM